MERAIYQSMFVFLSSLLLAVLFVLQPSTDKDMTSFQNDIKTKFVQASAQLVEGESFAEPFVLVWRSISDFYDISANQTIALLEPDAVFTDLVMSFDKQYLSDLETAAKPIALRAPTEDPVYNIVPMDESETLLDPYFSEDLVYYEEYGGVVAGESIDAPLDMPAPKTNPVVWMDINDSITGEPYCVAIFNGTLNSYPGSCAHEDGTAPIYEN